MKISDKIYDILSLASRIFVPLSVFIVSLCPVFKVPYTEEITAVLAAIDTFLGSLVAILKKQYDNQFKVSDAEKGEE